MIGVGGRLFFVVASVQRKQAPGAHVKIQYKAGGFGLRGVAQFHVIRWVLDLIVLVARFVVVKVIVGVRMIVVIDSCIRKKRHKQTALVR